jgi:hypothetical protein
MRPQYHHHSHCLSPLTLRLTSEDSRTARELCFLLRVSVGIDF